MRIVHVVQSLGMGGQERLILEFSRELVARGHDPMVISLSPGGELRPEFRDIPVLDVTRRQGGFDALVLGRLSRKLAQLAPDVVHTHNPAPLCYAVPSARALRISRIVHTKHGAGAYGGGSRRLAQISARLVSAFVAVSEETKKQALATERPPARKLHVISNGIPLRNFRPDANLRAAIRAELRIPKDAVVVGSVGRLVPEKNFALLIEAMRPLVGSRTYLVIAGDGVERRTVENAVPEGLRDRMKLLGLRRDVSAVLAACDIFALSSVTEGLPLVIPEAMSTGLPIVATSVGGVAGIVHPSFGRLVPSGDAPALSHALEGLIEDAAMRERFGQVAMKEARESFAIERMADRYLELYADPR